MIVHLELDLNERKFSVLKWDLSNVLQECVCPWVDNHDNEFVHTVVVDIHSSVVFPDLDQISLVELMDPFPLVSITIERGACE